MLLLKVQFYALSPEHKFKFIPVFLRTFIKINNDTKGFFSVCVWQYVAYPKGFFKIFLFLFILIFFSCGIEKVYAALHLLLVLLVLFESASRTHLRDALSKRKNRSS